MANRAAPRHTGPAGAWKIHLSDPLVDLVSYLGRGVDDTRWTVCGLHDDPDCPRLSVTAEPSLVTCGNCKRVRVRDTRG